MHFCSEAVLRTAVLAAMVSAVVGAETKAPETEALDKLVPRAVSVVRADARTGRLVRSIIVKAKPAANEGIRTLVEETSKNWEVNPLLVDSVIQVESNYNPYAVSPKGAQGLMQLMPATARRFGVTDSFDARQNIEAGVKYLKLLQKTFKDDRLAIAAYNAGEKAVTRYGDVPPYPETRSYVVKVGNKFSKAKSAAENSAQAKSTTESKPAEEETRHVVQFLDSEGRLHLVTQ